MTASSPVGPQPWVFREQLMRRRWLLPVAVVVADAVLLFGAGGAQSR